MSEFSPEPVSPAPEYPWPAGYGAVPPPPFHGRQDEYDGLPPLSQGERVIDTFVAPSRTFADIRRDRSWWMPYLLLVVFSLLFGAVVNSRVGPDTLAENAIRSNPAQAEKLQNVPADQRARAMRMTGLSMKVGVFSGPLSFLIFPAILALLIWVGFNFILGGSSTYPGMFAVAMYAALPGVVVYLLIVVTLFVGDPETFNLANPAATNPGYFMPAGTAPAIKSLLTSLDIFSVWQAFLLGLGGAIVARVKKSTGLGMVFGAWLLIILAKAAFAAATS